MGKQILPIKLFSLRIVLLGPVNQFEYREIKFKIDKKKKKKGKLRICDYGQSATDN